MANTDELNGKKVLITGANSGIGLVTAQALAARGASISIICRSEPKGLATCDQIEADTGHRPHLFIADLSDLAQVQRVANEVRETLTSLDVLVNNAGAYFPRWMPSAHGYERTFALNHLGYFLLTHHLTPMISDGGRIVNVASRAHRRAKLDLNDLEFKSRRYSSFMVYSTSKHLNILFNQALARRLKEEGRGITANCLHPGVVRTGFGQDYKGLFSILTQVFGLFFISPEKGAQTSIYLASSSEVEGLSGGYYDRCTQIQPRADALDETLADTLWNKSLEYCKGFLRE